MLSAYGAFELENQSVPPDGPAVMSVGERYGVGANLIHPIPVLSAIDRVIHSGWPNRKRGGTGRVGTIATHQRYPAGRWLLSFHVLPPSSE